MFLRVPERGTAATYKAIRELRGAHRFEAFSFGSICIDGTTYGYDVVIDRGRIRKRKKKPSKKVP
jgi:hypothetical protein